MGFGPGRRGERSSVKKKCLVKVRWFERGKRREKGRVAEWRRNLTLLPWLSGQKVKGSWCGCEEDARVFDRRGID
jgi:hypothetical protein